MEIHNLMEELVLETIEDIFSDQNYIEQTGCCNSELCKTDVACYVLNRISPMYTTSSRGLAHIGKTFIEKPQSKADITALVNEGIKQVGAHRRPVKGEDDINLPIPPLFNFPIIKGKVIDGKTFAPFSGADISLKQSGELVVMNGARWNNPSQLINETEGSFLFWPLPVKAETSNEIRKFSFSIELNAEGYRPIKHFINLELNSDDQFINSMEVNRIFNVEPIYLFSLQDPEEIIPGE